MATVGFESIYIGIHNEDGAVTRVHEINAAEGGAISASISGLGASSNTVYASNVPFYVASQGVSSPTVELSIADLSADAFNDITGASYDETNGIVAIGARTKPPYASLIMKSHDKDGNALYFGLTKAKGAYDSIEMNTIEDGGPELATDTVTFTCIARGTDQIVFAKGSEADENFTFAAFEDFIMGETVVTP